MEKGQSEVTNKIRSAIKHKLAEISDFVDDELPEYIMILVANQRSKSQIEKDLSLFLRNDTVNFTNWLWDLLNNLKVGAKTNQTSLPNIESDILKKEVDADEDAVVLDFYPDEHETDFLTPEDTNDSFISKSSIQASPGQNNDVKKESIVKKTAESIKFVEKRKITISSPVKIIKKSLIQTSREPLSSAVIPIKRKYKDTEDEYDPAKPEYEKPSHISKNRNYGGPAALQANKLLLKAVDDAAKSILKGKSIEDFYKPTPIKVLTSKQCNSIPEKENLCKKRNFPQQTTSVGKSTLEVPNLKTSEVDSNEYPPDVVMEDNIYPISPQRNRTICIKSVPLVSDSFDLVNTEYITDTDYSYSFDDAEEVRPKSPHFIVTLDGVNRNTFKRKFEENSIDSMEEDEEEEEDKNVLQTDETNTSPEKKLKLNERCKYWPACKNSDHCLYHHPTVPCKCFPDCKFGDKCLYIHPNCKFDALCSRKDCPFTHASKRKLPLIAVPVKMVPIKSRRMNVVCKFFPKCTSKNCPYVHPKLCRYGTDCRLPACLFSHFPVPSRSQMKWQATVS